MSRPERESTLKAHPFRGGLLTLTYATTDGKRYFRKERALTSFGDRRDTTAAVTVEPHNLGRVEDPDRRDRFAAEAQRMAEGHEPDDLI